MGYNCPLSTNRYGMVPYEMTPTLLRRRDRLDDIPGMNEPERKLPTLPGARATGPSAVERAHAMAASKSAHDGSEEGGDAGVGDAFASALSGVGEEGSGTGGAVDPPQR